MKLSNNTFFCKNCFTASTRPRITFDNNRICSACSNQSKNLKIDWSLRKKEFDTLCKDIRSKKNNYDCVVPFSGGKDSTSIALKLKYEFNLNPLLVTFAPLIETEIGIKNRLLYSRGNIGTGKT